MKSCTATSTAFSKRCGAIAHRSDGEGADGAGGGGWDSWEKRQPSGCGCCCCSHPLRHSTASTSSRPQHRRPAEAGVPDKAADLAAHGSKHAHKERYPRHLNDDSLMVMGVGTKEHPGNFLLWDGWIRFGSPFAASSRPGLKRGIPSRNVREGSTAHLPLQE